MGKGGKNHIIKAKGGKYNLVFILDGKKYWEKGEKIIS
jgi:hypothetical protein